MPPATITSQSGLSRQDRRDVQVVGDHAQPLVVQQLVGDRLGGGADVDDQRAAVRHRPPRRRGRCAALPSAFRCWRCAVGDVLGRRARHAHAAVKARQQAGVGQQLDVAAHRLQRHAELARRAPRPRPSRGRAPRRAAASWRGFGVIAADSLAAQRSAQASRARRSELPLRDSRLRLVELRLKRKHKNEERNEIEQFDADGFVRVSTEESGCPDRATPPRRRATAARRRAASRLRRARRRRRHQRRRHRPRRRRPRLRASCCARRTTSRSTPRRVDQADPRRPALPRVLRVPLVREALIEREVLLQERAAHHLAAALRAAARPVDAPGVDDPPRPVPLRPPRPARGAAGLAHASTCAAIRPARR